MASGYAVIWKRSVVQREIADLIFRLMGSGENVAPITRAMAEIERRLSADPHNEGESRSEFDRVLIVAPFTVLYEIYDKERVVFVTSVHYFWRQ